MLGKLTKDEQKAIDGRRAALEGALDAADALLVQEQTIDNEEAWKAALGVVSERLEVVIESASMLLGYLDDIVNEQREAFSDRSDKWQESDKAAIIDQWIGDLEEVSTTSAPDSTELMNYVDDPETYPITVSLSDSIDLADYRDLLDRVDGIETEAA